MEYVISKSFSQFQHEQQLPELESRLKAVEAGRRLVAYPPPCCLAVGLAGRECSSSCLVRAVKTDPCLALLA